MIDAIITTITMSLNNCGSGEHYDPVQQICQPYYPSDPQPGYPGFGSHEDCGYFDPEHGVCAPYAPATPPPFYQDQGLRT